MLRALGMLDLVIGGVDFGAPDGADVEIAFILLVPEAATQDHLDLLASLANAFSSSDIRDRLKKLIPLGMHDSPCWRGWVCDAESYCDQRQLWRGKSSVLRLLEDEGYYCVDNLPPDFSQSY
ncbi:MAG: hypothetical protein CM15mP74_00780 [Halieaceae bacterium]|nr:MAG: hypothetical protein CM15mP74_00780 [Halieaceae bacterium]